MGKRDRELGAEEQSEPAKRFRQNDFPATVPEDIHFARQLQELLVFRQDGLSQLRHGVSSFKAFLESILYYHDADDRGRHLAVLKEYLDSQKPYDPNDTERPFLGQLWQAWSFANSNNNDSLSSSLCAIFALLLKTLSPLLEFREYATLLCRTILQHQHLRLIKRCSDAPRHKDFLISPSLRLLIELTTFDGGVFAREVYKRRENTFDINSLRKSLSIVKRSLSDEDARRKPAIRTLAVRYILAHLKTQTEGGKIDILKQKPLCSALFSYLSDDPSELVIELLRVIESHVFKDNTLPRSAKSALLTLQHLERVTDVATRADGDEAVTKCALDWLKAVSTRSSYGIMRQSGWYPPGSTKADSILGVLEATDNPGLDILQGFEEDETFHIRNPTLLSWLLTLRPHANEKERELIMTAFKAAPELVHAYFKDKPMQLEPKLSNTWIGYASFLFEVIQLPIPANLGHAEGSSHADLPPQPSILIDNILPRPFTQKILSRCLNQSSDLITFFAIRLLIIAYQKLSKVQSQFRAVGTLTEYPKLWMEVLGKVQAEVASSCPPMKVIIGTFRQMPDDAEHTLQREAITRLLRLYYEVTPLQALEEQFDISSALTAALVRGEQGQDSDGDDETAHMRQLELEHLLVIATRSTGMRWFHKQGNLDFSPFVTLLRLHASEADSRQIRELVGAVLYDHGIINKPHEGSSVEPLDALVASLTTIDTSDPTIWTFLDDCFTRITRKPIKYLDDLDEVTSKSEDSAEVANDTGRPSLLTSVVLEQAPFVAAKEVKSERKALMLWINVFLDLLGQTHDKGSCLSSLTRQVQANKGWTHHSMEVSQLQKAVEAVHLDEDAEPHSLEKSRPGKQSEQSLPFKGLPKESDNHPELLKWQNKDLEQAIEDEDVDGLLLCLCSKHREIRLQAQTQIGKLNLSLRTSDLEEKDRLYILFGELLETYQQHVLDSDEPLPYLVGTFAAHTLHVLLEPSHHMYAKVNRYLMKSPQWRIGKFASYWLDSILLSTPEEDDGFWKEVQWILEWLVDGMRVAGDLDILRKSGAFEKVMALCSSPAAPERPVKQRVLELLYRAACIDGNTLVTRAGVLSWLDGMPTSPIHAALKKMVVEHTEKERVQVWAGVDQGPL